ncbi:MAG: CHAT domain-containing protein [Myxococcota bacterium]
MPRRWALVIAGVLVIALAWVAFGWRARANVPGLNIDRLLYRDLSGTPVVQGPLDPARSSADLLLEVSIRPLAAEERAVLLLFDRDERAIGGPIRFELGRHELKALVALRTLSPRFARRGLVLAGAKAQLGHVLERFRVAPEPEHHLAHITALAKQQGVRDATFDMRVPGSCVHYDSRVLTDAEARLAHGAYAEGLALVESLGSTLPKTELTRASVIAAECAFGLGRTALAREFAEAGLLSSGDQPVTEARLRRIQILASAEGSESREPPERERLRESEGIRSDPFEAVLDAVLDLRLALLQERFSQTPSRVEPAARRVLELAARVQPQHRLSAVAGALCRAAERVALSGLADGEPRLQAFAALARASENPAQMAACSIAAGDLLRKRTRWAEAEVVFADVLSVLQERQLPREQREAWYSAAKLAERRGDLPVAFSEAKRAAEWVTLLLSFEVDMKAREQLLVNTTGYYGAAARFGVLAGSHAAAIEVAESSKGQAIAALIQGSSATNANALSPSGFANGAVFDADANGARIAALSSALGPNDAAVSYTLLGMNERRRFEIAIGVVTREATRVALVEQPDTFLNDVVELARAVEQNQEDGAKPVGQRLYTTLLQPIAAELAGKDRLFVSPHLRLHTLPWSALHDGKNFVVQRFAVSRALPLVLLEHHAADELPIFNRTSRPHWAIALNPSHAGLNPLPGLEPVFDQLAPRFTGAALRAEQATAQRLLRDLQHSSALLFAGHANYDADEPLKSALFTASTRLEPRANLWPEDRIEARQLLGLARRPSLVLLLGCETARLWRGKSSYGDEAIGLARAFLIAGARRVVGALWPVVDRDAEDFLRALANIDSKQDPIRHVHAAQICLAEKRCPNRGISSWGSFLVDSR